MTCAAAYRSDSGFAVLAVDGRITDTEDGTIYSESTVKYCLAGSLVCTFAGDVASIQELMSLWSDARPGSLAEAMEIKRSTKHDWSAIVYDRITKTLHTADSDGAVLQEPRHAVAIGSGSAVAFGYLAARGAETDAWTPRIASAALRGAVKAVSQHNCHVGPRCAVLSVSPVGRISVRKLT